VSVTLRRRRRRRRRRRLRRLRRWKRRRRLGFKRKKDLSNIQLTVQLGK